jgi:hypothetical protein
MGLKTWVCCAAVTAVVSACGVDEAVGLAGSTHALDPAFEPVMAAYCQSLWRCDWPDRALLQLRVLSGSPEGCKTLVYRSRDSAPNHDLDVAIAAGRVRILAGNVKECVRSIDACRPYALNDVSPCGALFEGTVREGETCQRTEECAGDAYCRSDTLQCPGVCTLLTAPGGRCKSSQECGASPNAIPLCVPTGSGSGSVCSEVPIWEPVALGERCALTSNGAPVIPCARGLWCDHDFAIGAGVCRAPIAEGERCDDGDVCAGDAFCHGDPPVCRAARVEQVVGSACNPAALHWCDALQHLTCVNGTCQVVGDGTPGSACDPSELYAGACPDGFYCRREPDSQLGTCTLLGAPGESCELNADCLSGSCQLDGTCAAGYCAPY